MDGTMDGIQGVNRLENGQYNEWCNGWYNGTMDGTMVQWMVQWDNGQTIKGKMDESVGYYGIMYKQWI